VAERLPPTLVRRGFEQEVRDERNNYVRAIQEVSDQLAQVQTRLANGGLPMLSDLRQLTVHATEAYQRAAAWAALDRVAFMLPGDGHEEGE
jgi:hypothetical protein